MPFPILQSLTKLTRPGISRVYLIGVLTAAFLLAVIASGAWWTLSVAHESDVKLAYARADGAAARLASQTRNTLEQAEQLTALVNYMATSDATVDFPLLSQTSLLPESAGPSRVTLVDETGLVLDSTHLKRGDWLRDNPQLQQARQTTSTTLALSAAIHDPSTGRWTLPLTRRLADGSGNFTGAVLISLDAEVLRLAVLPEGYTQAVQALVTKTGLFIARQSPAGFTAGQSVRSGLSRYPDRSARTLKADVSPLDGIARFHSIAPVGKGDLFVVVALPETEALAQWRDLRERVLWAAGVSALVVLWLTQLFVRQSVSVRRAAALVRRSEKQYFKEKELLEVTLRSIVDAVVTTDLRGHVTYLNPNAESLTGWRLAEAVGRPIGEVVNVKDFKAPHARLDLVGKALVASAAVKLQADGILVSATGHETAIEHAVAPIYSRGADLEGAVMVLHDVSNAKKLAQELSLQASRDALTGLPNRTTFEKDLDAALVSASTQALQHVVLFIDLDQFKVVNDTCGHGAGDELLRQLTYVLTKVVRKGDTLARLGGDEFAMLLMDCPLAPALRVAESLRAQVAAFTFIWQDRSFHVGASIGVVRFHGAAFTRTEILRMADTACYVAKDSGRNRIHVYDEADEAVTKRQGEMNWAAKLQKALREDKFVLHGQKIRALGAHSGESTFEILVRLCDDDGRIVPPMAFLPAAERYGMMQAVDRMVIAKAIALYPQVRRRHPQGLKFCINLSGSSMTDATLVSYIAEQLDQHQVPAASICFEVTETVAISNLGTAVELITGLRKLGCTMALDDFGTGMSSFAYLRQLPVDYIKIDGSFVRGMMQDPVDFAMVEAIQRIAKCMGLKTVAEFVETPEVLEALEQMGVNYVQGYGVGKPGSLLASVPDRALLAPQPLSYEDAA